MVARNLGSSSAYSIDGQAARSWRSDRSRVEVISFAFSLHPEVFLFWETSSTAARRDCCALDGRLRIALHARQITFSHPTRREAITVVAPVPSDWPESVPGWPEHPGYGLRRKTTDPRG